MFESQYQIMNNMTWQAFERNLCLNFLLMRDMTMSVLSDKQEITVQMLPGIKPERSGCFRLNTGRNR